MNIENQSKPTTAADEWERMRLASQEAYKPAFTINSYTLNESAEFSNLRYNLSATKIETAQIGSKGTKSRSRVVKGGKTLFDTGECRRETQQSKLAAFLAQRIQLEAMRLAG